jgi:hypothetical protein
MEVDSHEAMDEPPFSLTARVMNALLRPNTGDELEGITNTNNKQNKHNKTNKTNNKKNKHNKQIEQHKLNTHAFRCCALRGA